ncbi:MAG: S1C family serine protease [Phycisphaerales bacterium]
MAVMSCCVTTFAADMDAVKQAEAARVEVIRKVYGTVVCVYGEDPSAGGGSGVLIDPSGLALTNFHVVKEAGRTGWAGLADERMYRWRLVGVDVGGDVALIQLTGRDDFPCAELGDSDAVRVGDAVTAMGNPFALAEDQTPSVSAGIVSGVHRYQEGTPGNLLVYGDCIQVDSSINPGNSGGPLFDRDGRVIGINGRGSFEERGRVNVGLGYAISANQIRNFLGELLATKVAQHATLDATFEERGGRVIATAIDMDRCVLVPLGLRLGDRLVRFNGHEVGHANQVTRELTTLPAGWPVEVVWEHDGERFNTVIPLNPLPIGQGEQPRVRMRLPIDGPPRRGELIPIDFEIPANLPGAIGDVMLNRELAKMLVGRCAGWKDAKISDALLLGSVPVAGGMGLSMRITEDGAEKFVVLSDDLRGPRVTGGEDAPARLGGEDGGRAGRSSAPADRLSSVIDEAQRKCVKIFGAGIGREHGYATGLIVSPDGLILTAQGVYLDGERVRVVLADGSGYAANVVRRDATSQLALLKIEAATGAWWEIGRESGNKGMRNDDDIGSASSPPSLSPLVPQSLSSPLPGTWVLAISNAFKVAEGAEAMGVTMGVVSLRATLDTKKRAQSFDVAGDVLLIDAITANPGAPGGAVIDLDGNLVGMIGKTLTSGATNTWLNYAIPADRLATFVHDRMQTPTATNGNATEKLPGAGAGELGIRIFTLAGRRGPAYIDGVTPDSPAAKAGLRKDDLVLAMDGQWVRNVEEYEQQTAKLTAGRKIVLTIKRGKEVMEVTVTAEEKR